MKCRRALATDYDEICRWWKEHGWDAVPMHLLPTGFVITDNEELVAAGFLYIASNAPVGYFEYVVTNPDNTPKKSFASLSLLFEEVMKFVEYNLIQVCFARIKSNGLIKMYERHGFTAGDKMQDMVWRAS